VNQNSARLVVELRGGFANQLFEYSMGFLLARETKARLVLDTRLVERFTDRGYQLSTVVKNVDVLTQSKFSSFFWTAVDSNLPRRAGEILSGKIRSSKLRRKVTSVKVARALLNRGRNVYLVGYLQDASLLEPHRAELLKVLRPMFPERLPSGFLKKEGFVAVHVRRGDYVHDARLGGRYLPPNLQYYKETILASKFRNVLLVSDDSDWCENVLKPLVSETRNVEISSSTNHFEDFASLLSANELILSNSTFSWWAAFIGDNVRVSAPWPWHSDGSDNSLILDSWVRIDRNSGRSLDSA